VRAVFDLHERFTDELTHFFADLNQWQSRYDLDADEVNFFASVLVDYVSEQLTEIERMTRPIARSLEQILPRLDTLLPALRSGLAARVDEAGLAANVAAAVHPDLTYVEVAADDGRYLLAEAAMSAVFGEDVEVVARHQGSDLLDLTYDGPFDDLPAVQGITHRVIPWTDVGADEGTGVVHIAPGAGEEDFLLGQELSLEVLVPIDENGAYTAGYDWLTGRDAREVADDVVADLRQRGLLYRHHTYTHRYPHCWRCHEELVFRVDDEWFIRADEVRQPMLDAAATVSGTPE